MDETTSYAVKARTEMVHRVLEGLRDEAFELARDIGIESLTEPGGLRAFITQMRNVVFPRAAEEARELFRAGQRGESMLSYVSRRRRWWKLLKSLDSSIELSEPMRVELLLELSGLSRQESLVIKACTSNPKSFEAIAATLVEHYSGVHLKEGRSLGGGTFQDRRHNSHGARNKSNPKGYGKGKTKGFTRRGGGTFQDRRHNSHGARNKSNPKGYGKGKTKGFTRRAYIAEDEAQVVYDDAYPQEDEDAEDYDDTSYPAFGDEAAEYEAHSLNCLEDLDPEEAESGHVIQLQLAANAAFGRAKGRKGKGKGR
eukprot:s2309_g1.t1